MITYSNFILTLLWFVTYKAIKYNCSTKIARNFTSFLHAFGVTIMAGLYLNEYSKLTGSIYTIVLEPNILVDTYWYPLESFSFGFFLYDLYHCFFNKYNSNKIESIGLTIHHVLSLIIVKYSSHSRYGHFVYSVLFLGELSNLPSYFMYYLKHSDKKNKWYCKFVLLHQALWYSFIRILICGNVVYCYYFILLENYYFNILWLLYYMGIYWSYKLWKQVYYIFQ